MEIELISGMLQTISIQIKLLLQISKCASSGVEKMVSTDYLPADAITRSMLTSRKRTSKPKKMNLGISERPTTTIRKKITQTR
jgi:hypothetical protein